MTQRQAKRWLHTGSKAWLRLRLRIILRDPLCRECLRAGFVTPTTEVDHIDGRSERREDYRDENLQGLCETCHSIKTHREQFGGRPFRAGCDESGRPSDPNHPWNTRK